jgi:hypothetical protein
MRPQRMKEFEFRLGKLGLVLFVIGISFLLFLTFVTGVMVGVNMEGNPDQISQGIPGILKQKVGRSQPGETGEAEKGEEGKRGGAADKGDFKLTFFDTLSKGKGAGSADPTQPKAKKEESKREEKAPEPARPALASAGMYVIQVASLQDKKKAEDLQRPRPLVPCQAQGLRDEGSGPEGGRRAAGEGEGAPVPDLTCGKLTISEYRV